MLGLNPTLPEVVEVCHQNQLMTVPTDLVVPVEATPDAPAVRERALADFASACGCVTDWALKAGNACPMPLAQEDLTMPEQVKFTRRCPNFRRLFLARGGPTFAREFLPKVACWPRSPRIRPMVCTGVLARINGISSPNRIRSGQRLKLLDGPFHAVVDKSAYRLDLWMGQEDDRVYVRSFNVDRRDNRTPEGQF